MERLTSYDEIGNKIEDCKNIVLIPKTPLLDEHYRGKAIDRLAEFEDFMEEQGFESLEEVKELLSANYKLVKVVDGLDKDYICECLLKYPKMQNRWKKLKEFIEKERDANFNASICCSDCMYSNATMFCEELLDKMEELEKENQNER